MVVLINVSLKYLELFFIGKTMGEGELTAVMRLGKNDAVDGGKEVSETDGDVWFEFGVKDVGGVCRSVMDEAVMN